MVRSDTMQSARALVSLHSLDIHCAFRPRCCASAANRESSYTERDKNVLCTSNFSISRRGGGNDDDDDDERNAEKQIFFLNSDSCCYNCCLR